METTAITCIDRDGNENNFQYWYDTEEGDLGMIWKISVIPESLPFTEMASFRGEEIDNYTVKITSMNVRNNILYSAKGIPEKVIEELASLSGKIVISSTNNPVFKIFDSEFRTDNAGKVWQRLVAADLAAYDEGTDIYTFTN